MISVSAWRRLPVLEHMTWWVFLHSQEHLTMFGSVPSMAAARYGSRSSFALVTHAIELCFCKNTHSSPHRWPYFVCRAAMLCRADMRTSFMNFAFTPGFTQAALLPPHLTVLPCERVEGAQHQDAAAKMREI